MFRLKQEKEGRQNLPFFSLDAKVNILPTAVSVAELVATRCQEYNLQVILPLFNLLWSEFSKITWEAYKCDVVLRVNECTALEGHESLIPTRLVVVDIRLGLRLWLVLSYCSVLYKSHDADRWLPYCGKCKVMLLFFTSSINGK